jgi:CRISPR/Cas system-associated endoribonuclease Cas2
MYVLVTYDVQTISPEGKRRLRRLEALTEFRCAQRFAKHISEHPMDRKA